MADTNATPGTDAGSGADPDEVASRSAFAPVLERVRSLEVDAREIEAAIAGGIAGGFQAALVLQLHDTDAIREIGSIFGVPTLNGGWLAMFALGALFALPFSLFVANSIDSFVSKVMMLSSRNDYLRKLLVPLLKRSALTTTTLGLGNGYGLAVGVLFSLFLMPAWLTVVMGVPMAIPNLTGDGLFGVIAWTLYGGTLGLVYGLIIEY
ncbi:hypothetical protein [Natronosalvus caseinilyticus]|uniref:hypothetical protein n=1 Tax=Natronosalvus caseinilyticus TaxID=2953747 RepID=UPI0028AC05CB|nr:hypothetical protein [Natronosalvus caseinilyticus]